MKRQPTISVRQAVAAPELWLNSRGEWGPEANRKRFKSQDDAEQFVRQKFGPDFQTYGLFPNC